MSTVLPPLELFLVRHGRSEADQLGVIECNADFPLTHYGQQQTHQLLAYLQTQEYNFQALYASPLLRASQTAIILAEALELDMITDIRLAEKDVGQMAGLYREDAEKRFPLPPGGLMPHHKMGGGTGESMLDFRFRLHECLWELREKHAGKSILLVSHGGAINEILHLLLQVPEHVVFLSEDAVVHHLVWGEKVYLRLFNGHGHEPTPEPGTKQAPPQTEKNSETPDNQGSD